MILEPLLGLSLVLKVSLDTTVPASTDPSVWTRLSVPQKDAALLPLVQRATECILRQVAADPRSRTDLRPGEINDLIVDSVAACRQPLHAMTRLHDQLYGDGTGEAFLLGPYLDLLPAAVLRQVRVKAQAR
jgi:hypothetical protein